MTAPNGADQQPPDSRLEYQYDELWREPPSSSWAVKIAKVAVVLVIIGIVAAGGAYVAPRLAERIAADVTVSTIAAGQEIVLTVPIGSTAGDIGRLLESAGLITDGGTFERTVRVQGVAEDLKAGSYTMVGGMSTNQIIDQLLTGPPAPDTFRLTVIEGLRIEEMIESLAQQTDYTFDDLAAPLLDGTITSPFLPEELPPDVPPLTAWEGLLFPATYDFVVDAPAEQIVGRLVSELNTRMAAVDWSAVEDAGLTPYEGLILASLIEKEAKLDEDRPLISSVIHNRLADGIALQIDATVIYALGENPGRVLFSDLEIDSPWNTYQNVGLPPTPIGGVRVLSLEAAANPAETDFYYYVLIDENGKHGFSETLEEHNEKVAQAREDGVLP
ncbi:MAG TPA: endolytic transglycosylase MltG [Acidimicrobiia bacterium]|nr:endolytic transglycosylase MltG [Acidimicrobiia bacterium]